MQFCQFIANIYPHMPTSFGQFNLIFNKLALIFLGVLIIFTVSSFEFQRIRQVVLGIAVKYVQKRTKTLKT